MASLILIVEGCERHAYPLGKATLLIGKEEGSDIQLPSEAISANHASIILEEGRFVLHDNGSGNGSFVNGEPAHQRPLEHKDLVRFGDYLFLVDLNSEIERGQTVRGRMDVDIEPPQGAVPDRVHAFHDEAPRRRHGNGISLRLTEGPPLRPPPAKKKPLKLPGGAQTHSNLMLNSL